MQASNDFLHHTCKNYVSVARLSNVSKWQDLDSVIIFAIKFSVAVIHSSFSVENPLKFHAQYLIIIALNWIK